MKTLHRSIKRFQGVASGLALAWLALLFAAGSATAAIPTFSSPVPGRVPDPVFTTALGPAVADFNGDTFLDIVSVDAAGSSIFLSLGNADGTNNAKTVIPGPTNPVAVLAADLNGDLKMDVVVATETAITYILNDGGAPFPFSATPVTITLSIRCVGVAVGDFNQDGYPDFVVSGDGDDGMGVTIGKLETCKSKLLSGAFDGYTSGTLYNAGASAARVAVGDLNGDNYPDVALARTAPAEGHGDVTIYFGNPAALANPTTFLGTPAHVIPLTHYPLSITIGDLTQDGKPDVVTTAYVRPTGGGPLVLSFVELIRNLDDDATTPNFEGREFVFFDYATSGLVPFSDVKIGDIDGDTVPDLVAIDQEGVSLHVIRVSPVRDENSVYQSLNKDAEDVFPLNGGPNQLALADLNGDQYLDVVVAHAFQGGLTTLLNTTPLGDAGPVAKAIQFDTATYLASEGFPAPVDVVVKRAADSTGSVTVKFAVGGTATPNGSAHSDFALADPPPDKQPLKPKQNTATLTFGPGETEKHIILFISQDPGSEPDETIILSLQTPTGDAVLGAPRVATVTIKDSEPPALRGGNKLTIKPSKSLKLIPADKPAGVKIAGRSPDPWTFTTTETKDAKLAGLALKVQYSLTAPPNEMWVDLPEGTMSRPGNKGTKWLATSTKVPNGAAVFFRTVASATDRVSGNGLAVPCRVVASPLIKVTMLAVPGNNVFSAQKAYPEEELAYKVSYQNTGTVPANNVIVAVQIPTHTHSDNGGGSLDIKTMSEGSASESYLAYFEIGTVGAGSNGFRVVSTVVDADALDGKAPKETVTVGFAEGGSKKFDKGLESFAARKKVAGDAVYGAVWDDPVPAAKPKPLYSTGGAVQTRIEHPIDLKVTAGQTIAQRGGLIDYEVKVNNSSSQTMQNVKFNAYVPSGTTLESVHQSDGNGSFDVAPPLVHPTPGGNPSVPVFQFGQPRLITWTIGELPPTGQRTIKYAVRVLYDAVTDYYDSKGVLHTAAIDNAGSQIPALDNSGKVLKFKGEIVTEIVDPFITANRVSSKPFKVAPEKIPKTNLSAIDPDSLPQPGLSREARGEGQGMGELKVKGVKGFPADKEIEVETVLPDDEVTYTMHFWNTGNAAKPAALARGCIIQDELPDGVALIGEFKLGKTSPVNIPIDDPIIVLRDKNGVVLPLPGHTLTADLPKVRVIEFRIGDLAAGADSQISYKVQPNLKAGEVLLSKGYQIWTESLSQPILGQEVVAVKAVLPISFTNSVGDPNPVPAHPGQELNYTVEYRNNGGFTASNVTIKIAIPDGTSYKPGSGVSLDPARLPVTIDSSKADTLVFTTPKLHASEETSTPDAGLPDHGVVQFTLVVKSQNELPEKLKLPGSRFPVQAEVNGFYPSGALARLASSRPFHTRFDTDPGGALKAAGLARDTVYTRLEVDQVKLGPVLWAYKRAPQYVKPGQKMVYEMTYGNSGDTKIEKVFVSMNLPKFVTVDLANSSANAEVDLGSISWHMDDLLPHQKQTVFAVFDLAPNATYPGNNLVQDTAYVISNTKVFNGTELVNLAVAPGPVVTKVYKNHATVSAWDSFTAGLAALGASIFGKGNAEVEESVHQFGDGSMVTSMRGADALILPNAFIIQNGGGNIVAAGGGNIVAAGGGNIVAAGGGNIVAAGGGNIVAAGGGNIVAAGGGNIVAAGGGNLISVQGIGLCTQANVLAKINGIVAGGGGNIVAAGGGNLIRLENGVAHLIGMDGASLRDTGGNLITIPAKYVNIVAAGGGNIVAAGGGNIVAAGGGNLQAALSSSKDGFVTVPNEAGIINVGGNPIPDIATVVANDGAGIIGKGGAGLIGGDAASFIPVTQ